MTTDTVKNMYSGPDPHGPDCYIMSLVSVFVLPGPGPGVRLVPGLCLPSGHIPGPAHASIFGHTQFSQFPQTAPSPQSRVDIDRDHTSHKDRASEIDTTCQYKEPGG